MTLPPAQGLTCYEIMTLSDLISRANVEQLDAMLRHTQQVVDQRKS